MKHLRFTSALCALTLVLGSFPFTSYAGGAQANVKIEQLTPSSYGTWTMLSSNGSIRTSNDPGVLKPSFTFGVTDYGPTTLSVVPPPGMSVRITVYRGGEKVGETDAQQYSFTLVANDNYRFVVQYSMSKLGDLGVTSDPSGVRFRMKGPSGRFYTATTPFTFKNIPTGRYSITFPPKNGCTAPSVHTVIVESETRNTSNISLATCAVSRDEAKLDYSRISKRTLRQQAENREYKPRGQRK